MGRVDSLGVDLLNEALLNEALLRWALLRWAPASSQTPWGDVLGGPHLPSPPLANR